MQIWYLSFFVFIRAFHIHTYSLIIKSSFLRKSNLNTDSSGVIGNQQPNAKRNKPDKEQTLTDKTKQGTGKMIELDFVSSDEEIWALKES